MHDFLTSLRGGRAAGAGEPPDADRASFGRHVRVAGERVEILGASFPRRALGGRQFRTPPPEVRAVLGWFAAPAPDARPLVPARDESFTHVTAGMAGVLRRIAEIEAAPALRTCVLLTGPTGCGKTTMVKTYCHLANEPCVELTFSGDTTLADFFRRTEVVRHDEGPSTVAALGPAVQAMLHGHKLLINEINMLPPDLISALTQAMDTGRLVVSGTEAGNVEIEVHERFGVFATANPNYLGTAEIGRALQRRFGWGVGAIPMTFLPPDEEAEAVAHEFGRLPLARALDLRANPSIVERLVGLANRLRSHERLGGAMQDRMSTRALVHWLALGHATGLPLAEIGAQAVLSIAPEDIAPDVAATARQALGRAAASVSYPDALRQALADLERPAEGAAVPVPPPPGPSDESAARQRAAMYARERGSDGMEPPPRAAAARGESESRPRTDDGTPPAERRTADAAAAATLELADGRTLRIRRRPNQAPQVAVVEGAGGDPANALDPQRALRAEYGLNLARPLGRVPPADAALPCLTSGSWRALRLAQGALLNGRPVFLRGPTGCGKSALARTLARLWNLPAVEFSLTGETSKSDLIAARRLVRGATEWSIQGFLQAASQGLFTIVNEYNLAYPDVHSIINGLFDKGGRLLLPDGRVIRAHPDFRLVATGFAEGPGVKPLNEGVENRFGAVIRLDYPPLDEEAAILVFVAQRRVDAALLRAAAELASVGRAVLAGDWDREAAHPLGGVPADLAAAAAERLGLTTAELVTLARASEDSATFVRWLRRGVVDGAGAELRPVLEAALAGYGLV